jgi:hypothetical protein
MASHPDRPLARKGDLVLKTVGDEVLVYDLARHRAHSLNRVAAAVWRACDGTRDQAAIAAALREADGTPVTLEAVRYALAELGRARLLTGPAGEAGITRRELARRLGTAAAVALPIVTSIVAPRAAQAQSGPPPPPGCGNCATPQQTPGCSDPVCQAIVCGLDPFCCEVAWDGICAEEAVEACACGGVQGLVAPTSSGRP